MIVVVDYGMGNIGSILNMFKHMGILASKGSDLSLINSATKLVLPGVGAFDAAMQRINSTPGLREALDRKVLVEEVPVLGVCLGMQLFTESSEEGGLPGLGWIAGSTKRFPRESGLKVPQMGWNIAQPTNPSPLTIQVGTDPRYYFVHSYYVQVTDARHSIMRSYYGLYFDSAISRDNIYGVQFHPEKSHRFGMQILKNFAKL